MISELFQTMADDLSITPYHKEPTEDYCYRVCYSALAYYLLTLARGEEAGIRGISKKSQTDTIKLLINQYHAVLGLESSRFQDSTYTFPVFCRKVYEEVGYLIVDKRNYDTVANYGRTLQTSNGFLYYGVPKIVQNVCGLGVYTNSPGKETSLFHAIMRDQRSIDEYITDEYNPLDFTEREFPVESTEFFDPTQKKAPSSSWNHARKVQQTVARERASHSLYKVMDESGHLLFAEIPSDIDRDKLTSCDHRRLYIALKAKFGAPALAWFNQIDSNHYRITLSAHLPNREYYYLLLSAWPEGNAFNRNSFIANCSLLPTIEAVLSNIGMKIIYGRI